MLDWGGEGPALVLLAGLGNTGHIFDDFAPAFTDRWHVYAITRRGFGASHTPADGYDAPALAGDVIRVLDELQVPRAILVGHSIAGEEMTWLAKHHPDRVHALAYLDAAYDRVARAETVGRASRHRLAPAPAQDTASPAAYTAWTSRGMGIPIPLGEILAQFAFAPDGKLVKSTARDEVPPKILAAVVHPEYAGITAPTLAVFAVGPDPTTKLARFNAEERARFARAMPHARVVELATTHYLFLASRDVVVRELRAFLSAL